MSKKFNPKEWLQQQNSDNQQKPSNNDPTTNPAPESNADLSAISDNTEMIISRIEEAQKDITCNYSDWLNLAFAFASEYGESGREYFHRISRFYPGYSVTECDKKYDQCLKSNGHGITIKSFFHQAREAGIDIRVTPERNSTPQMPPQVPWPVYQKEEQEQEEEEVSLPTFPESVYAELPDYLKRVVSVAETKEERDMLLIGTIVVLGACMPKLSGIYNGMNVKPNLYFFLTSQASGGKGRLDLCKLLARPIHYQLRRQYALMLKEYDNKMREYNLEKLRNPNIEKPERPPELMLYIPANNSATGMFQLLSDNDGRGIIFETEGDTLSMAFKSDHGNYSDGFRKAFHHESMSYYRRTGHEYVEIDSPGITTVLAGTPVQVATLIPNAENGLLSRFIYYYMNSEPEWTNVFDPAKKNGLNDHFNNLGYEFFKLYEALGACDPIQFSFTRQQEDVFHQFFSQLQGKYLTLQGKKFLSVIRRMGLIAFRIAMTFNGLRMLETGDFSTRQECQDVDFYATLSMIKVLIRHSGHVFNQLQEEVKVSKKANKKEMFFEQLPEKFTRKDFVTLAKSLSITDRTAANYINDFCEKGLIEKTQHNEYLKRQD